MAGGTAIAAMRDDASYGERRSIAGYHRRLCY